MKYALFLLVSFFSVAATLQGAVNIVVDFEAPDFDTATIVGTTYSADGFLFSVDIGSLGIMESDAVGYNGTQALIPLDFSAPDFTPSEQVLTISHSGGIFDANSIKIDGVGGSSPTIQVVGTYANNGETITQTFSSFDSLAGFEEVIFDTTTISSSGLNVGYAGLSSLSFTLTADSGSTSFQIDDFETTVVPEPSSALLVGLGALGLSLLRRRR